MSDDGRRILAVIGLQEFYVWEIDSSEVLFSAQQGAGLRGTWSQVTPSDDTNLPNPTIRESRVREANCDATFFISQVSLAIFSVALIDIRKSKLLVVGSFRYCQKMRS